MSGAASFGRVVATRAASETRLTMRRGENVLAMVGVPAAALAFFATIGSSGGSRSIETLLPGVLALALVASGLVNLGIATAFERGYGVLKRLGGSPLGRDGLITAKLAVVGVIAMVQVAALMALAVVLGWQPGPDASIVAVLVTVLVGSAAFAAIGLLLAGTLRPEATLVVANTLFLVALLLGGVLVPLGELPETLATIALISPVGALAEAFRAALGDGAGFVGDLAIVAVWGTIGLLGASRTFRWD
jgi:ABC-2 type transport system permease protein